MMQKERQKQTLLIFTLFAMPETGRLDLEIKAAVPETFNIKFLLGY